jgi:hypothetical protein
MPSHVQLARVIHREFKRLALDDALEWLADISQKDAESVWRALEDRESSNPFECLTADQLRLVQVLALLGFNQALLRLLKIRSGTSPACPKRVSSRRPAKARLRSSPLAVKLKSR